MMAKPTINGCLYHGSVAQWRRFFAVLDWAYTSRRHGRLAYVQPVHNIEECAQI